MVSVLFNRRNTDLPIIRWHFKKFQKCSAQKKKFIVMKDAKKISKRLQQKKPIILKG